MRQWYLDRFFRSKPACAVAIAPPPAPAKTREDLVFERNRAADTLRWAHNTMPGSTLWAEHAFRESEAALEAHDRATGRPNERR